MKKIIILLLILTLLFTSCDKTAKYTPLAGEYTVKCRISDVEYDVTVTLDKDLSGKLVFAPESEMKETGLFDLLPDNLTYPSVTPKLCREAEKCLKQSN